MAIVLNNITSGYNLAKINANFQNIEDYINDKLLARADTGVAGEALMERDLDMDGHAILNVSTGSSSGSLVTKGYVDAADAALQLQINNSLRFTDSIPAATYGAAGRASSLQGYDSLGKPIPVFSYTATADLAIKLASLDGMKLIGSAASLTELRSITGVSNGAVVRLSGDREGFWRVDTTDTTSADNSGTVVVTTGGVRLKRIFSGHAKASWFESIALINSYLSADNAKLSIDIPLTQTSSLILKSGADITFEGAGCLQNPTSAIQAITATGTAPSSWVSLSADASAKDYTVTLTSVTGISVGDWVEIRSEALYPAPNKQAVKYGVVRKVTQISGNTLYLDKTLDHSFLVADTAVAGKVGMLENIKVSNAVINKDGYTSQYAISMSFKYVENLKIDNCHVIGSKAKYAADVSGRSAIKVNTCRNVTVTKCRTEHQGWYGVEVSGASEDVWVNELYAQDVRHAVSINWSEPYGQPNGCTIENSTAADTTLSGFDTHDRGVNLTFINCRSYKAGDDGFQARATGTKWVNCYAFGAVNDGFSGLDDAFNLRGESCIAESCGRNGFNLGYEGGYLQNCQASGNQYGVVILGGRLLNCRFVDNKVAAIDCGGNFSSAQFNLFIDNCTLPASATQVRGVYFRGSSGVRPELVTITNSNMIGYGANWYLLGGYASQPLPPILINNTLDTNAVAAPTSGIAQLTAGAVTISTSAVRIATATSARSLRWASNIRFRKITTPSTTGSLFVSSITNGTSFDVKSSNASDSSIFYWEITL
ncbi:putative tail spike protein [Klebsiella phage KpnP_VR7901]|nr:putative tail spike protein [Klebsiella phage KpnP_VR7901]